MSCHEFSAFLLYPVSYVLFGELLINVNIQCRAFIAYVDILILILHVMTFAPNFTFTHRSSLKNSSFFIYFPSRYDLYATGDKDLW